MRRNPFAIWSAWYHRRPFTAEVVTVTLAVGTFALVCNALGSAASQATVAHLVAYASGAGLVSGCIGRLGAYLRRRGPAPAAYRRRITRGRKRVITEIENGEIENGVTTEF